MSPSIYAVHADGTLTQMDSQDYSSEEMLQRLLAEHPEILSGEQSESAAPRRWLLVTREAPIPVEEGGNGWFAVDHLFLDQDGIPTFVEVKRASDTRSRREVVAQMLDYAANSSANWPAETIRRFFEHRCEEDGQDPTTLFAETFGNEVDHDAYWGLVKTNLLAKRIRLMFVADRIPPELRRIVEFLNEVTDPLEVLALEISQFVGRNQRVLVPRIYGQTQDAVQRKRPAAGPATTLETFLSSWDNHGREHFERLFAFAQTEGLQVAWGTKGFTLRVSVSNRSVTILECYPPDFYHGQHYVTVGRLADWVHDSAPIISELKAALAELPASLTPKGAYARIRGAELDESDERAFLGVLRNTARQILDHGPV